MPTFGIVAEGVTDQRVLENVLRGYFRLAAEVECRDILPVNKKAPGGWQRVFEWLRSGRAAETLAWNDCLVIHIDTDCQEEAGFDVSRREKGKELSLADRVVRVIARLSLDLEPDILEDQMPRIFFAVAVESTECWLLPLLLDRKKASATTGCLDKANKALRKKDQKGLGTHEDKFESAYESASAGYRKRDTLLTEGQQFPAA